MFIYNAIARCPAIVGIAFWILMIVAVLRIIGQCQ